MTSPDRVQCEEHLLFVPDWGFLLCSSLSGFPRVFLWRSVPEEVHCKIFETSGTTDRPKMIQITAPWTAFQGTPVRPGGDIRDMLRLVRSHYQCTILNDISGQQKLDWFKKVALMADLYHHECPSEVPTLMELMICGDGWGMRAKVVRKVWACSSSSSLFVIRSQSRTIQFSDPQAGSASSKGCLFKALNQRQCTALLCM